jgi:hypothetical protein
VGGGVERPLDVDGPPSVTANDVVDPSRFAVSFDHPGHASVFTYGYLYENV